MLSDAEVLKMLEDIAEDTDDHVDDVITGLKLSSAEERFEILGNVFCLEDDEIDAVSKYVDSK